MMHAGLYVTTHGTEALTKGAMYFSAWAGKPDNADLVKIYLDRQLILAPTARECYLRV